MPFCFTFMLKETKSQKWGGGGVREGSKSYLIKKQKEPFHIHPVKES